MNNKKEIIGWFVEREEIFREILSRVVSLLKQKCTNLEIQTATQPEQRIKENWKAEDKIERKRYIGKDQLTDYAGCRFLFLKKNDALLFFDDINSDQLFNVDIKNTIDKRLIYDPDRFGYLSFHIVLSLKDFPDNILLNIKNKFPNDSPNDYKIEIQIRTPIQHTWAVISRHLIYDNIEVVPFKLRKQFYRLGAMLEAIDDEIEILFQDHKEKRLALEDTTFLKQTINQNNLKRYLELQIENNILVTNRLSEWISDLNAVEVHTIHEYHQLLMDFYENFYTIYRGKISEFINEENVNVSVDNYCGFPGWMIDAIIWHDPKKYLKYFHGYLTDSTKRSMQFGHPDLTEKYIQWLIDSDFMRKSKVN